MQTKPKSNSVVNTTLTSDGMIEFRVLGAGAFVFDPSSASAQCRARAMIGGFVQRISNGAALSRDTATGKSATPQDKFDAMKRLADHYATGSGEWGMARVGGGTPGLDAIGLRAIAEVRGVSVDEVRTLVTDGAAKRGLKPAAFLAVLVTAKSVAPVYNRMVAEGTGLDADDMLDGMGEEALM